MTHICVIIRHLKGAEPYILEILKYDGDEEYEFINDYLREIADKKIQDFILKFPEFNQAKFYIRISAI